MAAILVLDDDTDLRELVSETFEMVGHRCVTVGSVRELIERDAEALACDLAIIDINLGPGQPSGIDACEWLIRRDFTGRIAFLTGHAASHPLVIEAAQVARGTVLTKPLTTSTLLALTEALS
jgi:DNA-binding NtrC family response regulator